MQRRCAALVLLPLETRAGITVDDPPQAVARRLEFPEDGRVGAVGHLPGGAPAPLGALRKAQILARRLVAQFVILTGRLQVPASGRVTVFRSGTVVQAQAEAGAWIADLHPTLRRIAWRRIGTFHKRRDQRKGSQPDDAQGQNVTHDEALPENYCCLPKSLLASNVTAGIIGHNGPRRVGAASSFGGAGQHGCHPERTTVIQSAAKDLRRAATQRRFFAALRMTGGAAFQDSLPHPAASASDRSAVLVLKGD